MGFAALHPSNPAHHLKASATTASTDKVFLLLFFQKKKTFLASLPCP